MYLFAILKGKTESERVIKNTFLENDYTRAKIYFRSWIGYGQPEDYTLYKIGTIKDKNMIEPCKVFICGGYEINATTKYNYWIQKKFDKKKEMEEYKKSIEEAKKANSQAEIIQKLFNGRVINERRNFENNN